MRALRSASAPTASSCRITAGQLDGAVAPLDVLPAIVAAAPQLTVLLDGGVRRGTDVLKALALGAHAVFIGRPAMYGFAAGGEAGAAHALALLRREIDTDQALLGCADVRQLGPDWLVRDSVQSRSFDTWLASAPACRAPTVIARRR